MENIPPYKITIISNSKEKKNYSLEDAARFAMNEKKNFDTMKEAIIEASNKTGWSASDIGKTLANWDKTESITETKEQKEERDIEFGIAERQGDGKVIYLYND